ncbi:MAG: hypothetical protein U0166_13850 [Acidobacteriota bacterium]
MREECHLRLTPEVAPLSTGAPPWSSWPATRRWTGSSLAATEEAGEHEAARRAYLLAARAASRRYAPHEAVKLYRAYLRLTSSPSSESLLARCDLGRELLHDR